MMPAMNPLPNRPTPWLRLGAGLSALVLLGGCVVAPVGPPRQVVRAAPPAVPWSAPAAPPLYFYPTRAQTEPLQDRDRYECYRWAVRETGTDPGMTPLRQAPVRMAQAAPVRSDAGDVLGGAATGALVGAALSSPRHAGGNAVLGAIFGAVVGAAAGEARNRAIDGAQARQDAAVARARAPQDNFRRAMAACMQGRGYTVQ